MESDEVRRYHEVDVVVLVAEILHELLEACFLSAHLKDDKKIQVYDQEADGGERGHTPAHLLFSLLS